MLAPPSSDSEWFCDLPFSLQHEATGQLLTVTGQRLAEDVMEVAGTRTGRGDLWRVKFHRPPTIGQSISAEEVNHVK